MKIFYILFIGILFTLNSLAQTDLITSNGDFYNGSSSGWSKSGNINIVGAGYTTCNSCPGYAALGVDASGYRTNNAYGTLKRTFTIPSNVVQNSTATLEIYLYISTDETDNSKIYDKLNITLYNSSSQGYYLTTPFSNRDYSSNYIKKTIPFNNISNFAGQSMTLTFEVDNDNAKPTGFRLDDVSFEVETKSCTPVSISSEPQDKNVNSGNSVTFDISVTGTPPYSYFWYKDGNFIKNNTNTSNSSDSYTTPNLSSSDDGHYWYCLVTNCTSIYQDESRKAYVTVTSAPQYGSLNVTLSPQEAINNGAKWSINNGSNWYSSGGTKTDILVGTYELIFQSATGYTNPDPKSINISANNTTYESATYIPNSSAKISVNKSTLDFTNNCTSTTQSFTITNTGNADLTVEPIANIANYSTNLINYLVLNPNASWPVDVTFSPSGTGTYNGVLKINSNATNQTQLNITVNGSCNGSSTGVKYGFDNQNVYQLFWPFYNESDGGLNGKVNDKSKWENQKLSTHDIKHYTWYYTTHSGHDGMSLYAQDWWYIKPVVEYCRRHFYSPMNGELIAVRDKCPPACEDNESEDGCQGGFGNSVMIRSELDKDVVFVVCHMHTINPNLKVNLDPKIKTYISANDYIGDMGMTGSGTAAHFHCFVNKGLTEEQILAIKKDPEHKYFMGQSNACRFEFGATQGGGGTSLASKFESQLSFEIFPNPTTGDIKILAESTINQPGKIYFYDMFGNNVYDFEIDLLQGVTAISNHLPLSPGFYTLVFESSEMRINKKIILID